MCYNGFTINSELLTSKRFNMIRTTSDKQISRTFQGFFKHKLLFSRTKIYLIHPHSLTPFDHPGLLARTHHAVIYDFYFFGHRWSHYFILLSATRLCKMTGYGLQLHLRYRNSIWSNRIKVNPLFCTVHPLLRIILRHLRWRRFFPQARKEQTRATLQS